MYEDPVGDINEDVIKGVLNDAIGAGEFLLQLDISDSDR